ncbi:hypothetical protein O9992_15050 [Vibrio lentus]|nr:hypothetical protein [Vibrio lentus]
MAQRLVNTDSERFIIRPLRAGALAGEYKKDFIQSGGFGINDQTGRLRYCCGIPKR